MMKSTTKKMHRNINLQMAKHSPKEIRYHLFKIIRNDIPDNVMFRCCRARKFHVDKAIEMFIKAFYWRGKLYHADQWLFKGDSNVYFGGKHPEFFHAFELSQAYIRRKDKKGGPIVVISVKKALQAKLPRS